MPRSRSYAVEVLKAHPVVTSIIVALAASAILNRVLAKKAERRNPPTGRFIRVAWRLLSSKPFSTFPAGQPFIIAPCAAWIGAASI
jgi:hypothetical protein